ncbi:recombinase family protein [Leekyejoonella antrihumi]|uniref:recombinase family protein n=1 Tax=Leekyejoonella antrihumi TaxID=1660198 RepID=UPI00319E64D4
MLNTVKLLQDNGIHIRSMQDGIDPSIKTGRLMRNMLATLAKDETRVDHRTRQRRYRRRPAVRYPIRPPNHSTRR